MRGKALAAGAREAGVLRQEDVFFAAPGGRLKLRRFDERSGELIAYRRPDGETARVSEYHVTRTAEPDALARVLRYALEETVTVRKHRRLLLHGHTRIHLDRVEGLGSFVELETVLDGITETEGRRELAALAETLGLEPADAVSQAYADLSAADRSPPHP